MRGTPDDDEASESSHIALRPDLPAIPSKSQGICTESTSSAVTTITRQTAGGQSWQAWPVTHRCAMNAAARSGQRRGV